MIASFGLPVVMTAGRLMILSISQVPSRLMTIVVAGSTVVIAGGLAVAHLARRRTSRRGSNS